MTTGSTNGDVPARVLIVGSGLMGTSLGLAARAAGCEVWLSDREPAHVETAADMNAGVPYREGERADLAVLAVPPYAVGAELAAWQGRDAAVAYTDVASVKARPRRDAAALGCDLSTYAGGHPLAGRELSGPGAAVADLFLGRPWAVCPGDARPGVVQAVLSLARAVGADPLLMTEDEHDVAVASVSHAPHTLASVMAAQLAAADTRLAGQGVRDVTRVADGDPRLWTSILTGNAAAVADVLDAAGRDLAGAARALRAVADGDAGAGAEVRRLLERGVAGRLALPGKHGGPTRAYAVVTVVLPDRPGQLARLFRDADAAGVNVEDVALEHSPGAEIGVVELSVRPESRDPLVTGLRKAGWDVAPVAG
ncbi:MAG: prephenate dehydrogenase [Streptosporangiales bacterium]|nr:prephenate dehydrogenase [Streptosporangiales bacterium]